MTFLSRETLVQLALSACIVHAVALSFLQMRTDYVRVCCRVVCLDRTTPYNEIIHLAFFFSPPLLSSSSPLRRNLYIWVRMRACMLHVWCTLYSVDSIGLSPLFASVLFVLF